MSSRFFQTTSKISHKGGVPEILSNCFKTQVQGISEILSNYFKNKTQGVFQILSNYFKYKTQSILEILSNYFKNQAQGISEILLKGVPEILSNYFNIKGSPRSYRLLQKPGTKGSRDTRGFGNFCKLLQH